VDSRARGHQEPDTLRIGRLPSVNLDLGQHYRHIAAHRGIMQRDGANSSGSASVHISGFPYHAGRHFLTPPPRALSGARVGRIRKVSNAIQ
jgi:hypothetical protein